MNEAFAPLPRIVVRGTRDGLVIILPERGEARDVILALTARIASADRLFRGAEVVLDYGTRQVNADELAILCQVLDQHRIVLRTVTATGFESRSAIRALGYSPLSAMPQPPQRGGEEQPRYVPATPRDELPVRYVRRTFRSGMSLHQPGHLVVVGDVNAGAELTAAGDIVVFGALRGVVHAGALGDTGAIVAALVLTPTQLRISNIYGRLTEVRPGEAPGAPTMGDGPCIAHLDGGELLVAPWYGGRDVPPVPQ